jgi:hypothetical protein
MTVRLQAACLVVVNGQIKSDVLDEDSRRGYECP